MCTTDRKRQGSVLQVSRETEDLSCKSIEHMCTTDLSLSLSLCLASFSRHRHLSCKSLSLSRERESQISLYLSCASFEKQRSIYLARLFFLRVFFSFSFLWETEIYLSCASFEKQRSVLISLSVSQEREISLDLTCKTDLCFSKDLRNRERDQDRSLSWSLSLFQISVSRKTCKTETWETEREIKTDLTCKTDVCFSKDLRNRERDQNRLLSCKSFEKQRSETERERSWQISLSWDRSRKISVSRETGKTNRCRTHVL